MRREGCNWIRTVETNASSIMGLEIGPSGKLWYVDEEKDVVVRLDPHPDRDYDEVGTA